jgi:anti-sigma regulatory factor (Ser/Thr protein kinase)
VAAAFLTIPSSVEHVRTARLVAVAAARRAGLGEEALDDVRLAVVQHEVDVARDACGRMP